MVQFKDIFAAWQILFDALPVVQQLVNSTIVTVVAVSIILLVSSMAGFAFESDETVDEMINSLATETAALPLLQFAAQKLWEGRDTKEKLLSRKSYDEMGGVEGALVRHADAVVENLSTADRKHARTLFQRLVTPEGTRAILSRGELSSLFDDKKVAERLLRVLTEARLLVVQKTSDDEEDSRVEIVHIHLGEVAQHADGVVKRLTDGICDNNMLTVGTTDRDVAETIRQKRDFRVRQIECTGTAADTHRLSHRGGLQYQGAA